jgi:hypothetical protein
MVISLQKKYGGCHVATNRKKLKTASKISIFQEFSNKIAQIQRFQRLFQEFKEFQNDGKPVLRKIVSLKKPR